MKLFTKTAEKLSKGGQTGPLFLTDDELDAVAAEDERRRLALAERERRIEERRLAAEEEARQEAARAKEAKIAELRKRCLAAGKSAARTYGKRDAVVVALAEADKDLAVDLRKVWNLQDELKALGAPWPPLDLQHTPEAMAAGARLVQTIAREFTLDPLAHAHPGGFPANAPGLPW